jgi:hypothetical protein
VHSRNGDQWRAPIPWRPVADEVLRHGYTVSQVSKLSVLAVKQAASHSGGYGDWAYSDRLSAAWFAAIEHLYTTATPPGAWELVDVARRAVHHHNSTELRHHGRPPRTSGANFTRYWDTATTGPGGHDEHIIESLTLRQIFAQLSTRHQQVLLARADHPTMALAAQSLGMTTASYHHHLTVARRLFRQHWHEGEQPSAQWRIDRRDQPGQRRRETITYRLIVAHQRRKQARATSYVKRPRPRKELAATIPQIVARLEAGESLRSVARSLGVTHSTLDNRLTEAGIPPTARPGNTRRAAPAAARRRGGPTPGSRG